MSEKQIARYGTWKSPITSDLIVADAIRLRSIALDGGDTYWIEERASEGGRNVLVRRDAGGDRHDVSQPPFSVRTRVHEYGGAPYVVSDGTLYFVNDADQRLYRQAKDGTPEPLTGENHMRYADGVADLWRRRLIFVREDHSDSAREAVNTLISIGIDGANEHVLVSGHDFYSTPRLSPDGRSLAWLAWNHPHMPWDGCELWLASLTNEGDVGESRCIAGGGDVSIFQPSWSPNGVLHYVSDRTGWWNLYSYLEDAEHAILPMEAEFGRPQWSFGTSTYGFAAEHQIVCAYVRNGAHQLVVLDTHTGAHDEVKTSFRHIDDLVAGPHFAVFRAGSATEPEAIVHYDLATAAFTVLRRSATAAIDANYIAVAEHIEFATSGGRTAFGYFYRPTNQDYAAPAHEKPPLLVNIHGGPTGAASDAFDPVTQYWTSRGIAVLDVDYGGSTGYGTAYRRRLNGQWGIVDVDDCLNGARHLVNAGLVDRDRLLINGGSAGGYTTLCALTFHNVFKAGASYYGVSDVEALALDTHKFESRYLDSMIGPYPERRDIYVERSPINHVERLATPLILFQGLEDKVVPPSQAEAMFEAVKAKGMPVAYLPFPGEQHGFRKAEHIKRALDAEFYFYAKVFGYSPADTTEPVEIVNMPPT